MSDGSTIEWLDRPGTKSATWNPIRAMDKATGRRGWFCVHVHEGCRNCYAERINMKAGDTGGNGWAYEASKLAKVDIVLHENTLLQPLKWKSPRTIFVCSMTDLYGPWVKDEWLDKIKAVQALTPQHTYIELTKRPKKMRDYAIAGSATCAASNRIGVQVVDILDRSKLPALLTPVTEENQNWPLPLKNVWGLVSCSTQEDADKFIPILLNTPLAIRGVSAEPLLGKIDFRCLGWQSADGGGMRALNALAGHRYSNGVILEETPKLDWIIVGGESGRNARPMHPEWARLIQRQCEGAGTPLFFKQWGQWGRIGDQDGIDHLPEDADVMTAVGKSKSGRLLDGAEHNGFPQARTT